MLDNTFVAAINYISNELLRRTYCNPIFGLVSDTATQLELFEDSFSINRIDELVRWSYYIDELVRGFYYIHILLFK